VVEIDGRARSAEPQARLWRVLLPGEVQEDRSTVSGRARGMTGPPGDRIPTLEGEPEVETLGGDPETIGAALLRRDGGGGAGHSSDADEGDRR